MNIADSVSLPDSRCDLLHKGLPVFRQPHVRLSLVKLVEPLYTEPYGGVIARITNAVGSCGSVIGAEQLTFICDVAGRRHVRLAAKKNI